MKEEQSISIIIATINNNAFLKARLIYNLHMFIHIHNSDVISGLYTVWFTTLQTVPFVFSVFFVVSERLNEK